MSWKLFRAAAFLADTLSPAEAGDCEVSAAAYCCLDDHATSAGYAADAGAAVAGGYLGNFHAMTALRYCCRLRFDDVAIDCEIPIAAADGHLNCDQSAADIGCHWDES